MVRYTEHDCQDSWFDVDNAATHATEFRQFRERYPRLIQSTPEQTAKADALVASWKKNYKWRKYTGINPHKTHIHISFTAKAFLSNVERIEPLFYGQAGLQIKVMPRLSAFRKKRVDLYTKGTRAFSLNDDSTDFLRNIVFDEADARGISTQEAALQSLIGRGDETVAEAAERTALRIKAEEAKRVNKFSVYSINKRIDNFAAFLEDEASKAKIERLIEVPGETLEERA